VHKLGTQTTTDRDIFSNESNPELGIAANEIPIAFINKSHPDYIIGRLFTVHWEIGHRAARAVARQAGVRAAQSNPQPPAIRERKLPRRFSVRRTSPTLILLAAQTGLLIMAAAWGVLMAFNLITLPVEFDASRRAKLVLGQMGFIQGGLERAAVNQVLNAAAWTYVAAFISSLVYFLWHLLPLLTGHRDDD